MPRMLWMVLLVWAAAGQTQIDLSTQAKNLPIKSGASLPKPNGATGILSTFSNLIAASSRSRDVMIIPRICAAGCPAPELCGHYSRYGRVCQVDRGGRLMLQGGHAPAVATKKGRCRHA